MAKGFAIHNAPTDHGGRIPSTQMRSSQQGNLFVRVGDGHFCPKCKCWSTVIKSHDHVIFDGKAVAYVGDKLTCGARIQPQQSHVVGDSGGENYTSVSVIPIPLQDNFVEDTKKYGIQFQLRDEKTQTAQADVPYSITYLDSGAVETGWTDAEGKTHVISADAPDRVEFQTIDASKPLPPL